MITVDLAQDSYDLIRRAVVRRMERGAATAVTEREWAVIQAARQVGREQRLSMGRQEAESLYDWFEKTFDIVGALGDRWPNAGDVLDAARREARAMAEREYYCVDCGRIHVASLWDVRQVNEVGRPLKKTDYLCGEAVDW